MAMRMLACLPRPDYKLRRLITTHKRGMSKYEVWSCSIFIKDMGHTYCRYSTAFDFDCGGGDSILGKQNLDDRSRVPYQPFLPMQAS
ncbi:hypothetical protein M378DRAFT_653170 [Amanita muscaria Koide BX008]|uniref:Uncharacterized protein n=1 Tax=Amanita muscaria (strain Koide BX008) TaxID=946122 RepID=A0A0C2TAE8_AMAMK|nr:hypothetical protein M378DRAFT_653170 [Amanita muscaria Koide BX008]